METVEDDDELKLAKASAGLLANLEKSLPKLLWMSSPTNTRAHTRVKKRDLDHVIKLIESFQSEPQLLDARLKSILPPIVAAYLEWLQLQESSESSSKSHIDFQTAVCAIIYTLCKVRGSKVVVGFFKNEPRYVESVLSAVERVGTGSDQMQAEWQVQYVLLLWLSHLLLTPFDLASISTETSEDAETGGVDLPADLPSLARKALVVGLKYLPSSTKAQEAAAALLVRLVNRPDMQRLHLADVLVIKTVQSVQAGTTDLPTTIYERLGPLRFLAGITSSPDLGHLLPHIYRTCEKLASTDDMGLSNAVVKKVIIKAFRNIAIFSLRAAPGPGLLLSFLETTGVVEDVIDYLLLSVGDRDTPVRYAAAKAISLIVQAIDPSMGYEVLQAILDTFKEDIPKHGDSLDFRTADALKWHGLTLALAHALFKRTASPEQVPDIVRALSSALQFEQRTATGSNLGTNVRDAANFGIWALSRRYTTDELLAVDMSSLELATGDQRSVIQHLAIELILSACTDPAGNIRRGSSAALQELIGRHPNQVYEGISLVQIVDYQAVSLRHRALVDVADRAAALHPMYWGALTGAMLGWRGLGSADVPSREGAAASLASLSVTQPVATPNSVLSRVTRLLNGSLATDVEALHGWTLSLACIIEEMTTASLSAADKAEISHVWASFGPLQMSLNDFSTRTLRSELPTAIARLIAALCVLELANPTEDTETISLAAVDTITARLLSRYEEPTIQVLPPLVRALLAVKQKAGIHLSAIEAQSLANKVTVDASKSTTNGAGRAIALGALVNLYAGDMTYEERAAMVDVLIKLVNATSVEWRIIGIRALTLVVEDGTTLPPTLLERICDATHQGLNDYTIDERGDVGSLVRLRAITCSSSIFRTTRAQRRSEAMTTLDCDILRTSLEKLDRVRIQAAQCRHQHLDFAYPITDVASVSSYEYFHAALHPLRRQDCPAMVEKALLEGVISCAGVGAETLLQASRAALTALLDTVDDARLSSIMTSYAGILKTQILDGSGSSSSSNLTYQALELLAFMLDMHIPQRLATGPDFKWRNLLSTVQKSHHKSNDIPKLLAATQVYRGLAGVEAVRGEVLKKLVGMLKTNPYPRIRVVVAEVLWAVTGEEMLKGQNWAGKEGGVTDVLGAVQKKYVV